MRLGGPLFADFSTPESWVEAVRKGGFVQACWCGSRECEDRIKDETGAKITNLPYDYQKLFSPRCVCGDKARYVAHWAKSY